MAYTPALLPQSLSIHLQKFHTENGVSSFWYTNPFGSRAQARILLAENQTRTSEEPALVLVIAIRETYPSADWCPNRHT